MKKYHICVFCKQEFYGSKFLGEFNKICCLCKQKGFKFPFSQEILEKRKQTNLRKYGVENPSQSRDIKEKKERTMLERYGFKNPSQSPKIKEKIKKNNLRKYGVESHNSLEVIKEKKKQTLFKNYDVESPIHSKEIKEKIRKTNLEKYSCKCVFQNSEVKEKIKKTNIERYGVEYPMSNPEIMEKSKETSLKKYGVTHPTKLKQTQKKKQQTNLRKYGVKHPLQSDIIKEKTKKTNSKRYGTEWNLQSNNKVRKNIKNNYIDGKLKNHLEKLDLLLLTEFARTKDLSLFQCKKCKYIFTDTFFRIFQRPYACPKCKPQKGSIHQKEINTFLQHYVITEENTRNIIPPKELDIYIPSKQIAIEFDGLYWHSELILKDKNYHLNKTLECEKKNIQLIHIFEDEWIYKQEIVKSKLKQILGVRSNNRIHARKYIIKEITTKDKNDFLEKYHIQRKDNSKIKLGAFYNDELVSVMTFSKGNISKGAKAIEDIWELNRFCSNYNYHIPGVAGKLLKYFQKHYHWKKIFSYVDRRWSKGNVYEKLGFKLEHISRPNYWYIKGMERLHRFNFKKTYDEPKHISEGNLRLSEGYVRIWDCGNLKYTIEV